MIQTKKNIDDDEFCFLKFNSDMRKNSRNKIRENLFRLWRYRQKGRLKTFIALLFILAITLNKGECYDETQ